MEALPQNLANAVAGKYDWNIKQIFIEAWRKVDGVKKTFWGAAGLLLLVFVAFVAVEVIVEYFATLFGAGLVIAASRNTSSFIFGAFSLVFATSFMYMMICNIVGRPVNARMVFDWRGMFSKLLMVGIITYLLQYCFGFIIGMLAMRNQMIATTTLSWAFFVATLVMMFGYLYFLVVFRMAMYLIIEKKLAVVSAIKSAFVAVTRRVFKNIWLMILINLFLIVSVLFTLGIGLIWFAPMAANLHAIWYRQIFGIEPVK